MRRRGANHRQCGFVLVLVLGVVILMSVLLLGFGQRSRAGLTAAAGFRASEQAVNCARAGVQLAIAAVRDTNDLAADPRFDKFRDGTAELDLADGTCSLTIVAESGRFNVNALKDEDGKIDRKRVDQFLKLIDLLNREQPQAERLGYGLAAAIIDWTDADDDVTQLPFVQAHSLGAESSTYATLDPPRSCRNRPLDAVDELLDVRGVTPQVLERMREFLTTRGDGRININAAPALVLESLAEDLDATLARTIVQHRRAQPFRNVAELRDVPGMTDNLCAAIEDRITVGSAEQYYRVRVQASVADRQCQIEAVLRRNTQARNVDIVWYRQS